MDALPQLPGRQRALRFLPDYLEGITKVHYHLAIDPLLWRNLPRHLFFDSGFQIAQFVPGASSKRMAWTKVATASNFLRNASVYSIAICDAECKSMGQMNRRALNSRRTTFGPTINTGQPAFLKISSATEPRRKRFSPHVQAFRLQPNQSHMTLRVFSAH